MQPQLLHVYQNHTLDSLRWDSYAPRDGDIIISTSYKSGTTWMQEIVKQLINWNEGTLDPLESPWPEFRLAPPGVMLAKLAAQTHRRFIKTHLPLDGLTFYPQVKYIVVGRDARDVFMSWWNHYSNYTDFVYESFNNSPDLVGLPLPRCPADLHRAWREWITRGWFEWEHEGYPFWGNMHHTQSWWNFRQLDNIFFVHYNDLLTHLPEEIQRLATFLEITIPPDAIKSMLPTLTLEAMRRDNESRGSRRPEIFQGGEQTFFFKGTNGRWKDVLTAEELTMYEDKASQVLTSDCRAWLEQGLVAQAQGREE